MADWPGEIMAAVPNGARLHQVTLAHSPSAHGTVGMWMILPMGMGL